MLLPPTTSTAATNLRILLWCCVLFIIFLIWLLCAVCFTNIFDYSIFPFFLFSCLLFFFNIGITRRTMRSLTTMKTRDNSAISRSRCSGRTECILGLVVWSVLLNLSCSRTKVALIGRQTIQKVDIKLHQQNEKKKDEKMVLSLLPPNITYNA